MIKIKVRKTSLVKPAEKTVRRSISLTFPDRVYEFPRCNSSIYLFKPTEKPSVAALRESLSKTLVHFYPMAGRPKLVDEYGITEIDCNDEGVLFVEAETESDLDQLGDLAPSSETSILVPPMDDNVQDIASYSLMAVQVTYFKCGGVSLGIRMEHQCLDGSSAFHLIKSWSEIARGLKISLLPFLDRASLICPRDPPRPMFEHIELSKYGPSDLDSTKNLKISVLGLTRDQLDKLKANSDGHSTFEALAGHIWRCVSKSRGLKEEEVTNLIFLVNLRANKMKPNLPRGFFGNAVLGILAVSSAGDLVSEPLSQTADRVHKALVRMDDEYVRSAIDYMASLPDLSPAKIGPHNNNSPNFQVTSWANMGLDDVDFGWGSPFYSGPGNIRDEKAYVFPNNSHISGLSVAISLRSEHIEMFEELFYEF